MASIGSIVGGAFRLFRERPATVAIWAVVHILFTLGLQLMTRQQLATALSEPGMLQPGAGGPFATLGWMVIPIWIGSALFYAVMTCAVFRAVLRPSQSSFASMRLGMDELRLIGLGLLLGVGLFICGLLATLLLTVVVGGIFAVTGGGITGGIVAVLIWLGLLLGGIYLWVRLSLIFPLTFARRQMAVDEAWGLTRGRFWTLFAAYLVIWVITIVLLLIAAWPYMAPYFQLASQGIRNPEALQQLQQEQMDKQLHMPFATMLVMGVVNALISLVVQVLGAGVTASATRELLLDRGELLEDDAERTAAIFE